MKIILAPDKFKGTLTAAQVVEIERQVLSEIFPDAEIVGLPLADGGEGTVEALTAAMGGKRCSCLVRDPLGVPVEAEFGMAGKTAIIEMAAASGLMLIDAAQRDPLKTSTYGTGELIRAALDLGAEKIIIGIGGSATVDGGSGMAQALGYRFFDCLGGEIVNLCGGNLGDIAEIDCESVDPRLAGVEIIIAADVNNPLLGERGAVAMFAPQKGGTPENMPVLERGLANLREVLLKNKFITSDAPGDGAAGGLGLGLRGFAHAKFASGARLAIETVGLPQALQDADYVITGEGCTDAQTENGKLCMIVADYCEKAEVPCILLSGRIEQGKYENFCFTQSTIEENLPFAVIKRNAVANLRAASASIARKIADIFNV